MDVSTGCLGPGTSLLRVPSCYILAARTPARYGSVYAEAETLQ